MIFFAVYAGRVAIGYTRNLRTAKAIAHDVKRADEIHELHIPDVKGQMQMDIVRRWQRHNWSKIFIKVT